MTAVAHPTVSIRHATVTIRLAEPGDGLSLRRLAELDSSSVPDGEVLLAEVDGVPRAALATATGAVIADPFEATAHLVEVLRATARAQSPRGSWPTRRGIVASARARIAAIRAPRLAGV